MRGLKKIAWGGDLQYRIHIRTDTATTRLTRPRGRVSEKSSPIGFVLSAVQGSTNDRHFGGEVRVKWTL